MWPPPASGGLHLRARLQLKRVGGFEAAFNTTKHTGTSALTDWFTDLAFLFRNDQQLPALLKLLGDGDGVAVD